MAKKGSRKVVASENGTAPKHGAKSAAVREYLTANKNAMPKEISAALLEKGIVVSPNMVSIIKAKMGIKRAKKNLKNSAAKSEGGSVASGNTSAALDAAMVLYKAARGAAVPQAKVTSAFLALVEVLT